MRPSLSYVSYNVIYLIELKSLDLWLFTEIFILNFYISSCYFSFFFFLFFFHHKPFLFTIYSVPFQSNIINIGITWRKIFNSSLAFVYLVFSLYGLCRAYILKPDVLSDASFSFYDIFPPQYFTVYSLIFFYTKILHGINLTTSCKCSIYLKKKKKKITLCHYPKLMGFIDQQIWHQYFIIKQLYICIVNQCFIQHNSGHAVRLCQVSLALSIFFLFTEILWC